MSLSGTAGASKEAADPVVVALPVRWIITRACVRGETRGGGRVGGRSRGG